MFYQCHIIDLKLSEKPYKIFEVENVIKFLNGKTEMEHVIFAKAAKSNSIVRLKM